MIRKLGTAIWCIGFACLIGWWFIVTPNTTPKAANVAHPPMRTLLLSADELSSVMPTLLYSSMLSLPSEVGFSRSLIREPMDVGLPLDLSVPGPSLTPRAETRPDHESVDFSPNRPDFIHAFAQVYAPSLKPPETVETSTRMPSQGFAFQCIPDTALRVDPLPSLVKLKGAEHAFEVTLVLELDEYGDVTYAFLDRVNGKLPSGFIRWATGLHFEPTATGQSLRFWVRNQPSGKQIRGAK